MITPTVEVNEMVGSVCEGLARRSRGAAVSIRPLSLALDGGEPGIVPEPGATGVAICLEEVPMPPEDHATRLTATRFRRPGLDRAAVNAKAGCPCANKPRGLAEARAKGHGNAPVAEALGNVAETATARVFPVRDGEVFTPVANGTFRAGITRTRPIADLRAAGIAVHEALAGFDDARAADEVFLSGNLARVTPVGQFDGTRFPVGPVTRRARALCQERALSGAA